MYLCAIYTQFHKYICNSILFRNCIHNLKGHINGERKDIMPKLNHHGDRLLWLNQLLWQGFRYHHAESDYLMLVFWIPETADTIPANASHRVGIGAFVMNSQREVLVVQENSGKFKGTSVWKLPTGVVDEGEDICTAAIREVKEETGIETEFVEVLAFRQSHKSFYRKSDIFFVCMLRPHSFDIQKQNLEIADAQWMPVKDYAAQSFIKSHEIFDYIAKICIAKLEEEDYAGFSPLSTKTASGKTSYLYFNSDLKSQLSSDNQKQKMPM